MTAIAYISHGAWCDPELVYKRKSYNYYDVEDSMLSMYREEHDDNDDGFDEWILKNKDYVFECIEELDGWKCYFGAPSYAYPA